MVFLNKGDCMDKKAKIIIGLILCGVVVAWIWLAYYVEQTTWKPNSAYKSELSNQNYEVTVAESQGLKEKDIEAYRTVYYNRANFYYYNTRCTNSINDYSIALEDCEWDTYKGVCKNSPGYLRRGNCYFKSFKLGLFLKDYVKFFSMHIIRTIAYILAVTFTFAIKYIIFVAPLLLILVTFAYLKMKRKNAEANKPNQELSEEEQLFKKLYKDDNNTPKI